MTVSEIKNSLKWEKERACHVLVSAKGHVSGYYVTFLVVSAGFNTIKIVKVLNFIYKILNSFSCLQPASILARKYFFGTV